MELFEAIEATKVWLYYLLNMVILYFFIIIIVAQCVAQTKNSLYGFKHWLSNLFLRQKKYIKRNQANTFLLHALPI